MQTKTIYQDNIYNGSLILVNKDYPVHSSYHAHIVSMDNDTNHQIEKRVNKLIQQCFQHLNIQDDIQVVRAFRSFNEQKLYHQTLQINGKDDTQKYEALPLCSEHETGLAIDLALKQENIDDICSKFTYTKISQKFRELCYDYGFIERYQEHKQDITNITKDSAHFRYVGFPHSLIMKEHDMCLEEYHDFLKQFSICQPYTYVVNQRVFDIFYVPITNEETSISLRSDAIYQVSGNNQDGVIFTVWRRCL